MSTGWRYELSRRAVHDVRRLDAQTRRRIFDALDRLTTDPQQSGIRKVQTTDNEWRVRVGDRRIRFERQTDVQTIYVLRVLPRGRAYRD